MPLLQVVGVSSRTLAVSSLELEAGECVALSGPSGAGKSQLLRAIADLDPHQGEVLLEGQSAESFVPGEWRRQVGLLPAESQWWAERIGDHFAAPDEEALAALGFDAGVMQWQVARCSTGERQRLALLRLLGNRPRVLLLDEPTASLDPASVRRVEALVERYRREQQSAVLWVSHDPEQIQRVAGRHLLMHDGSLEAAQ